jgi:uncharacterized membrane protein SpoIIM required for sporulation
MNIDHASLFGIGGLLVLSLLGGYLILLQIREYFYEKPDPKLTYMTKSDFEKYAGTLRTQISELASLSHVNAQQIAALAAQTEIILQRTSELSTKLDRIQERNSERTNSRLKK